MKVLICGYGVTGSALGNWLVNYTRHQIVIHDPPKNRFANMEGVNVAFVCVPAETNQDGTQDLSNIHDVLAKLPKDIPVFIRSTVLPGTCKSLSKKFNREITACPEFLTERQAYDDMVKLPIVCGGNETFLLEVFGGYKTIHGMTNEEAELTKYIHNGFAAVKVGFFNIAQSISESLGCEYKRVLAAARLTGFIEESHTMVPGPDGKYGFGGKCLPKDLKAFAHMFPMFKSLSETIKENDAFRNGERLPETYPFTHPVGEA